MYLQLNNSKPVAQISDCTFLTIHVIQMSKKQFLFWSSVSNKNTVSDIFSAVAQNVHELS